MHLFSVPRLEFFVSLCFLRLFEKWTSGSLKEREMMRGEIEPAQRCFSWLMNCSLQSVLITSWFPLPLPHPHHHHHLCMLEEVQVNVCTSVYKIVRVLPQSAFTLWFPPIPAQCPLKSKWMCGVEREQRVVPKSKCVCILLVYLPWRPGSPSSPEQNSWQTRWTDCCLCCSEVPACSGVGIYTAPEMQEATQLSHRDVFPRLYHQKAPNHHHSSC